MLIIKSQAFLDVFSILLMLTSYGAGVSKCFFLIFEGQVGLVVFCKLLRGRLPNFCLFILFVF